jgi:hypothetical protein
MTVMTEFAMLPYDVQLRAKLDASDAWDVRNFYDLAPEIRRAVYEAAVARYWAAKAATL